MKYGTYVVYGIKPEKLAKMNHLEALKICKQGAIDRANKLTINSPLQQNWCNRRRALINYINKSRDWCDSKILEFPKELR